MPNYPFHDDLRAAVAPLKKIATAIAGKTDTSAAISSLTGKIASLENQLKKLDTTLATLTQRLGQKQQGPGVTGVKPSASKTVKKPSTSA